MKRFTGESKQRELSGLANSVASGIATNRLLDFGRFERLD